MTKVISEKIKGIAILLMIAHHLFLVILPDTILIPAVPYLGFLVEDIVAVIGKICVGLFAFISGYGLYVSNKGKPEFMPQLKRILQFYEYYWIAVLITVASYVFFIQPGVPLNKWMVFRSFLGFDNTLNGAWWYVSPYLLFLIALPFTHYFLRDRTIPIVIVSMGIYLMSPGSFFLFGMSFVGNFKYLSKIYGIDCVTILLYLQLIFLSGYIFAKHDFLQKISRQINRISDSYKSIALIIFLTIICFLRYYASDIYLIIRPDWKYIISNNPLQKSVSAHYLDFLFIPLFIIIFNNLLHERKGLLNFFGYHSANMWLLHGTILIFAAPILNIIRWTPAVYAVVVGLSALYSLFIYKAVSLLKIHILKKTA